MLLHPFVSLHGCIRYYRPPFSPRHPSLKFKRNPTKSWIGVYVRDFRYMLISHRYLPLCHYQGSYSDVPLGTATFSITLSPYVVFSVGDRLFPRVSTCYSYSAMFNLHITCIGGAPHVDEDTFYNGYFIPAGSLILPNISNLYTSWIYD